MGNVVWQLMCIIYAISALFMQGVFCIPSHCDINMVLIILQGGRSGKPDRRIRIFIGLWNR